MPKNIFGLPGPRSILPSKVVFLDGSCQQLLPSPSSGLGDFRGSCFALLCLPWLPIN